METGSVGSVLAALARGKGAARTGMKWNQAGTMGLSAGSVMAGTCSTLAERRFGCCPCVCKLPSLPHTS